MVDTGEVKMQSKDWQKHQAQQKKKQRNVTETALISDLPSCSKVHP